jgi:hypothetical protein
MNLSKDEILALKKDGSIKGLDFINLLKTTIEEQTDMQEEIAVQSDKSLTELTSIVSEIKTVVQNKESVLPILERLDVNLIKLISLLDKPKEAKKEHWDFIPEYDSNGRIVKLTAR